MNSHPKISVVTPSYNQAPFLEQTIRSVLDQDYDNVEYIVMDGGSNDESVNIIRRYSDRLSYWISAPDGGQSEAINRGFERTTGDILCWLNSDDYFEPGALSTVAQHFHSNPGWKALNGGCRIIEERYPDQEYTRWLNGPAEKALEQWSDNWFAQPSTFWSRELWVHAGPLRNDLHFVMDIDLWRRFVKQTSIHSIPELLATCRVHDLAKCSSSYAEVITEMFVLLFAEYPDADQQFKDKVLTLARDVAQGSERAQTTVKDLSEKLSKEANWRGALQSEAIALRDSRWFTMRSSLKRILWRK